LKKVIKEEKYDTRKQEERKKVRKDESTGCKTLEAKKPNANGPSKERIWHFVSRGSGKMMDGWIMEPQNTNAHLNPGVLLQDITPRTIMTLELLVVEHVSDN
jgi:hypothetical protein